jgi:hypothetical protein
MLTQKGTVLVSVLTGTVFLVFALVAFNADRSSFDMGIAGTSAKMEFAFSWTLRAAGSLIAIIAAIHLILFAGQRDSVDQLVPGSVALLGGLLLLGQQHWVLVTVFGVLIIAFIIQQPIIRWARMQAVASQSRAGTQASPAQDEAVTGIHARPG